MVFNLDFTRAFVPFYLRMTLFTENSTVANVESRLSWCNDNPLLHGTAEEAVVYRQRKAREREEVNGLAALQYSFTEILSLKFFEPGVGAVRALDLKDITSTEGSAFGELLRVFLQHGRVNRLLWGMVIERLGEAVVLIGLYEAAPKLGELANKKRVEWPSMGARELLYKSPELRAAREAIQNMLAEPVHTSAFRIEDRNVRDLCFGCGPHNARNPLAALSTALCIWKFLQHDRERKFSTPLNISSCSTTIASSRTFEMHWEHYALKRYQRMSQPIGPSPVGGPVPWAGGWAVQIPSEDAQTISSDSGDAYCGIFGHNWYPSSQEYFKASRKYSYQDGGILYLEEVASGGFDIFHVHFTCLKKWEGSVIPPFNTTAEIDDIQLFPRVDRPPLFRNVQED